jgi:hypothetical protein
MSQPFLFSPRLNSIRRFETTHSMAEVHGKINLSEESELARGNGPFLIFAAPPAE